tara:strand:- start:113 stop:715 length:603 start_codon:yes stop_codon:yes gene_type:complete
MGKKGTNPYTKMIELIEKLHADGGSTDDTWHDIVHIHQLFNPEPKQKDNRRDLDEDILSNEFEFPEPDSSITPLYTTDEIDGTIFMPLYGNETKESWISINAIFEAVYAIRETVVENFCVGKSRMGDSLDRLAEDSFPFLDQDIESGFVIPEDFSGGISISSTKYVEDLQNQVQVLEAADKLSQSKIRCLEKRITKPEKK